MSGGQRTWYLRRVLTVLASLAALLGASTVDGKKKSPGLFDFGGWKSPETQQRDFARDLEPGTLDLSPASGETAGPPRALRLRVYADRDYRETVLRWQAKLRGQIDRVNRVVGPVFNVVFEIESLRDWNQTHRGVPLEATTTDLEALDPATDVDWVLGLVTPFRGVATSIHQIGWARLLARHFVLRGMDDEQEGQFLQKNLDLLSPEERARVYKDRKAHKEIVVFLHEWAHTMGALHDEDHAMIMNPACDPRQAAFSAFEKRLILLVLDRRLSRRSEPFPESADVADLLESAPPEEGADKDRAALLEVARARAHRGEGVALRTPGPVATADLPPGAAEAFNRAVEALKQAASSVGKGNAPRAAALVMEAAARVAAAPPDTKLAMRLAELAGTVGALTTGEVALARVGRGEAELAVKLTRLTDELDIARRRLALPRDAARWGIPPDKEPTFCEAFWETAQVVAKRDVAGARARLRDFGATYPDAPATDLLTCELALREGDDAAGIRSCEAALAKFDEAARAHTLLARIATRQRHTGLAEKHLRRAILLDPGDDASWRELAHHYRANRANTRLDELRAQYRALRSSPLPE